ncbi:sugar-transfer associated ATP-grasp domain-containing protein [Hasllibacter sp. MH4015]|uniref:sugar-transfer associated ATP-grasp domain-containing protein n=1 Tax=Hasllibacter sp. MH4015 TaxID=2854029 RepID=UPI001CD2F552|nr:sugar-transfer associated ATP-grasp domain-containing protein [Hasllibacter sp. MH4015]
MNMQAPISAAQRDYNKYSGGEKLSVSEMVAYAAKKSGRSALQIGREFQALNRSVRKINMEEYLRWGLYDDTRFDDAKRAEFISNDVHWPIAHKVNKRSWQASAEDKMMAASVLSTGGVAVPETVAVIDHSQRIYPGIEKVGSPEQLRDVIKALGTSKLFGKMRDGMVSFGAFRVRDADATHIICDGLDPMTYEAFFREHLAGDAYLLQRRLDNHSDLDPFASGLATVRMLNLVRQQDVYCPIAIISMPQGDNVADTLWRSGNIACEVDVASGQIKTIVRRNGHDIDFLPDHDVNAGLMGMTLPHWDKLREMNERAARIFEPIKFQSTDIAITQDGPVVVELNYGSGFGLPQNASGRGLLNPVVRGFFEQNGINFDGQAGTEEKKAKGGFSLFGKRK